MKILAIVVVICLIFLANSQIYNCTPQERNVPSCPRLYRPMCGCGPDNYTRGYACRTYDNRCFACNNSQVIALMQGYCAASRINICPPGPKSPYCPMYYHAVCGFVYNPPSYRKYPYSNECFACNDMNKNVSFWTDGTC